VGLSNIRNFSIVAHIDHGKSTLADRLIELTGTVPKEKMREQLLDQMDIERERGITIKLAPVRMIWQASEQLATRNPQLAESNADESRVSIHESPRFVLNLIDTPGHVDFSYEVSRTLACVEGVILLVDATQGIQAQTLANLHLAQKHNLAIIPVVNKIDLPSAEPEKTAQELVKTVGSREDEILFVSGKTGEGVPELLAAIIERIPPPKGKKAGPFRALIFDSIFDPYRGVVAFVRAFDGELRADQAIRFLRVGREDRALEVGFFAPTLRKSDVLQAGEIGYVVTGLKEVAEARVGDTMTSGDSRAGSCVDPIPGYAEPNPMVFASFYPLNSGDFGKLREALLKYRLTDASFTFSPEHSPALGAGFRIGFLGLLHLEIAKERLEKEYGLSLVVTTPLVDYRASEGKWPHSAKASQGTPRSPTGEVEWSEPWVALEIITPAQFIGPVMEVVKERRAEYKETTYLTEDRVLIKFAMPLAEMIVDFYDRIKSVSSGYASVNYEFLEYRSGDLVRLDILVAGDKQEAFSQIVHVSQAQQRGREMIERLKSLIPRQWFEVRLQAAIGSKVIASEKIPALRKDVTAKLYGGDVTRKRKLLEKQKEGKVKMKRLGKVDIPTDVFLQLLKR
jgi:GTP-binding protein LepA